jgi:DNA-3-methyladenine glycosylase II
MVHNTTAGAVVEVDVRGRFELNQSIRFGFGQRDAGTGAVMRLAFCLDGYREYAAAVLTQPEPGLLRCEVLGSADPAAVAAQAARVLSVDVDGTGYDQLGERVPLVGAAQARRPGLRPPLFHSAYEALLWAVLSARRPQQQMAQVRERLAREHGRTFDVAGQELAAVPTPERMLAVAEFPGIPEPKLRRMHGVARAALDGGLDTVALRELDPAVVVARLQELEGIGPFYAELVTVRALGLTDELPLNEPRLRQATADLLGEPGPLTPARLSEVAESWRPWRTWVAVAIRAGGPP